MNAMISVRKYTTAAVVFGVCYVVISGCGARSATSDADLKSGKANATSAADRDASVPNADELINGLISVNTNSRPHLVRFRMDTNRAGSVWHKFGYDWSPIFPRDYNWDDEKRVHAALFRLWTANREELWPRLVERSDDTRYSMTYIIGESCVPFSVGHVCWWIARNDLLYPYQQYTGQLCSALGLTTFPSAEFSEAYYPELCLPYGLEDSRTAYSGDGMIGGADLRKWYKERAGQPLYKLQIEVCEHVIREVEKLKNVQSEVRSRFLKQVSDQVESIRKTRRAVLAKHGPINREVMAPFTEKMADEIRNDYEAQQRTKTNPLGK